MSLSSENAFTRAHACMHGYTFEPKLFLQIIMACQRSVSVSFLMVYYDITEHQCNKQISEIHIRDISRSACRKWRSLVAYLGMKEIVISDIEHESTSEEERRCNLFSLWRDEHGYEATYRVLIDALLEMKCRSDAEYVCQLLQMPCSSKCSQPPFCTSISTKTGIVYP